MKQYMCEYGDCHFEGSGRQMLGVSDPERHLRRKFCSYAHLSAWALNQSCAYEEGKPDDVSDDFYEAIP